MTRRTVLIVTAGAAVVSLALLEGWRSDGSSDAANGGGAGDGARDVTSSHPLPNETATPEPRSGCGVVPGR